MDLLLSTIPIQTRPLLPHLRPKQLKVVVAPRILIRDELRHRIVVQILVHARVVDHASVVYLDAGGEDGGGIRGLLAIVLYYHRIIHRDESCNLPGTNHILVNLLLFHSIAMLFD